MDTEQNYDRIEIEGDQFYGTTFRPTNYEVNGLGFRRYQYSQMTFNNHMK